MGKLDKWEKRYLAGLLEKLVPDRTVARDVISRIYKSNGKLNIYACLLIG